MGEPFCAVFQKIPGIEKIYGEEEEGGGSVTIFGQFFFVSQCRKIALGNLLGCHYFRVSKIFLHRRVLSRISVEFFCLTVPKSSVGESFSISLI